MARTLKEILFKTILSEMMDEIYEEYEPTEIVEIAIGAIKGYQNIYNLNNNYESKRTN